VKYEANPVYKSSSGFSLIKVFYKDADKTSQIQYSIDNGSPVNTFLEEGSELKKLEIKTKSLSKKFYLKFVSGKAPIFYGVSLESNSTGGIYVDNFPMRGNSGSSLSDISEEILKQFNKEMHYDLIILNYGANVSSGNKGIFTVYENKMVNVIEKFKRAFPETSILIVSSSDRTQKIGGSFKTNPDVLLLLEAQKRIAERTGSAFWNLQEVQGGNDSMDDWVDASPPLALKDYAHFTSLGGEKVANFLFDALMDLSKKF
jgi:lysophospholipase L1-like esterase